MKEKIYTSQKASSLLLGGENVKVVVKKESESSISSNEKLDDFKGSVSINKECFNLFLDVMNSLKQSCQDLIINKGRIFQFNDKKNVLYDIDMSSFLPLSVCLSNLKMKFNLLSVFKKSEKVVIDVLEDRYTIGDKMSKIIFRKMNERLIENSNGDYNIVENVAKDENIVFTTRITAADVERITSLGKLISTNIFRLFFNDGVSTFKIFSLDRESTIQCELIKVTNLRKNINNKVALFPLTSFEDISFLKFDVLDIVVSKYKETLIMKKSLLFGDKTKVEYNIYSFGSLLDNKEEKILK